MSDETTSGIGLGEWVQAVREDMTANDEMRLFPRTANFVMDVIETAERRRQARLALDAGHLVRYPSSRMERLAGAYIDAIDTEDAALRTLLAQIAPPERE